MIVECDTFIDGKYDRPALVDLIQSVKEQTGLTNPSHIIAVMSATVHFNNDWLEDVAQDGDITYTPAWFDIDEALNLI